MRKTGKRALSLLLTVLMLISLLPATAFAAPESGRAGGFDYTVEADGTAVITGIDSSLKGTDNKGIGTAILVPAQVDKIAVSAFGNGGILLTNYDGDVLLPEGVTTVADGAIYDVGNAGVAFFSFPSTISEMTKGALASTANVYYTESDTADEACVQYGLNKGSSKTRELTIEGGDHGAVYPNGTYLVADDAASTFTLSIVSDQGYAIDEILIDGKVVDTDDVYEAEIPADLSASTISVSFREDAEDTRSASADASESYQAPAIVSGAVSSGAVLPDDVNTYCPDIDGEGDNKYPSTMGVETGTYYAVDGQLYEMVAITQNVCYRSKAEVINAYYENEGLVFGQDYDLIRVYNYVHDYANGPRPGNFVMYCTYLYKSVGDSIKGAKTNPVWEGFYEHCDIEEATFDELGMIESSSIQKVEGSDKEIQGDVATVLVQKGATVTMDDLESTNNTVAYGPSEAANFYGLGSAVLVDGGNKDSYQIPDGSSYSFNKSRDASSLVLNNPHIIGIQNVAYAVAGGTAYVNGGRFFGSSSGGHGFYVGMGGKIAVNADDVLDSNGQAIIDVNALTPAERPAMDLGIAVKADETNVDSVKDAIAEDNWETPAAPYFYEEDIADGTAVLVTADETGTALTTDTGGGVIVANNLSATTYGRGCAGVYSIGADESYVMVYNSALHSNLDGALVSASAGYIFAYNCELKGVDGLKTRSGGDGTWSGITVYNSKITSEYEPDHYAFYDVSTPDDVWPAEYKNWQFADDKSLVNAPMLNLFINKTNASYGSDLSDVMKNWYEDKNKAPQTGEAMAPILSTGSAPIEVHSAYIENNNYKNYAQDGASNILIAADNAGSGTIRFYDCNSSTPWDLTGANSETTELSGNVDIAAIVTMDGPDAGSGPSSAPVEFYNSEWTGSVTGYARGADFTFDDTSVWTVDTQWTDSPDAVTVNNLTLANENNIVSDSKVTVNVLGTLTIGGEEVTGKKTIGNVTITPVNSAIYTDLNKDKYAEAAVAADSLAYNNVLSGVSETKFKPSRKITRGAFLQALYAISEGADVANDVTGDASGDAGYSDLSTTDNYYRAVAWAKANGILDGVFDGDKFKPNAKIRRWEALMLIYNAADAIGYTVTDPEGSELDAYSDGSKLTDEQATAISTLIASELFTSSNSKINPKAKLTRADAAILLDAVLDAKPSGGMMMPPGMMPPGMGGASGDAGAPPPPPN